MYGQSVISDAMTEEECQTGKDSGATMALWVSRMLQVLTCPRGGADMRRLLQEERVGPCRTLCILRPGNLKSMRVPPPWRCQEKIPAPRPQTGGPQLHYTALSRVRPCNSTGVWAVCISTNCRHTGPYHPLRLGLVTTTELSIQCQPQGALPNSPSNLIG